MANKLHFLEQSEVEALLAVPNLRSLTGLRNRAMMQLMAETGMRIGEVLNLRVRDIVLGDKRVEILRGKGDKSRTVFWHSAELTMLMKRWKEIRPKSDYLFCIIRSSEGKGKKIDPRGFRLQFSRYVQMSNLPSWVTPHKLRHTYATRFLRGGGNLRVLQVILGHESLATTQVYTHVTDKDVRLAMRGVT